MDIAITSIISLVVGVLTGGFLGYTYGKSVQAKLTADLTKAEQAAQVVKKVL